MCGFGSSQDRSLFSRITPTTGIECVRSCENHINPRRRIPHSCCTAPIHSYWKPRGSDSPLLKFHILISIYLYVHDHLSL
jgi:hypothetical protein